MKITNFSFTVRQAVTKDGYGDNYYVTIDENGTANVSHPYKSISHKEQAAILGIIQSGINKYGILVKECNRANQALKLEEYAESAETISEEQKGIAAAKLSAAQELESALAQTSDSPVGTTESESIGAEYEIQDVEVE